MDILDNTECKFNVNSFKIVYVVNSEYYLYKRTALTKAREVGNREEEGGGGCNVMISKETTVMFWESFCKTNDDNPINP